MVKKEKKKKDDVAELAVGPAKAHVPMGLIDRIAPARAAKSMITARMGQQISNKLSKGEPLDEMERFFFTTFFEKEMKRYKRQLQTRR